MSAMLPGVYGGRRRLLALLAGLFAPAGALVGHALVHALEAASGGSTLLAGSAVGGEWWARAGAVALLLAVAAALWMLAGRVAGWERRRVREGTHSLDFYAHLWWRLAVLQLGLCGTISVLEAFFVAPGLKNPLHGGLLIYAALTQSVTALLVVAIVRVVAACARRLSGLATAPWAPPLTDPWWPWGAQPVLRRVGATVPVGLRAPPVPSL